MRSAPVILVLVPGLSGGILEGGAMPRLAAALPKARTAGLVNGFPSLPASAEASALRGQLPSRHRVRLSSDAPSPAHPTVGERLSATGSARYLDAGSEPLESLVGLEERELVVVRRPELLESCRRKGIASRARLRACADLDESLAHFRESIPAGSRFMLFGGPGARPVSQHIRLPEDLPSTELEMESAVLRVKGVPASERSAVRDALLRTRGVERVLLGDALNTWGAASASEDAELYALAQPGWSFEEEAASVGHPELPAAEDPRLIVFGSPETTSWPSELHDHRLAPSLARELGLPADDYLDRAFIL